MLEVARIDRAHGLRGEVLVTLISDRPGRLDPGSILATGDDPAGPTVEVASSRPHQHRWLVSLAGVGGRSAAEALRGTVLYAEPEAEPADDTELWVHQLVGARVATPDGVERGCVEAVVANAASDLLELDSGALVPVVFVADVAGLPDRLVVDPPEGIFDL